MSRNKEAINLSWLVEKWTIWDNSYLKNIWLNLDTLDLVRINDDINDNEDIEESYIDIENNMDEFVCMPGREAVNEKLAREVFMDYLDSVDKDRLFENYNEYSADEEFLDLIYELGLEDKLQDFRDKVAGSILLNWANEEDIKVNKDMEVIDLYSRN
ncbi:MAG: acyl carrier protein [Anaerococcus sp.]|nr:hypothetical protein HMPREF3224_00790 [Anaerococcus hydrogenalis]MDU2829705.1 acyl carrier protein [Anaerococcus sp.]MDU6064208.1 acyl carrier protein [Anaerococcus sp.]